jgi:hypothetical protein
MFGFGCLGFVLICTILAVACYFVFRSGEQGKTKLGAPAGCLVGCALVFVALLSAMGMALVLCFHVPQEMVRRGPFKRFEFDLEPRGEPAPATAPEQPDAPAGKRHARLTVEVKSGADWAGLSADISSWLREQVSSNFGVRVETRTRPDGPVTALVFEIDVDEAELQDLRRELREVLPTMRLPRHVEAELKDD